MEMNFPHDSAIAVGSTAISLRKLDMDILRVLAFAPALLRSGTRQNAAGLKSGDQALMAYFAGSGRADQVMQRSFNKHFAVIVDRLVARERQGEAGVYHSASVNRKAARLLRSNAPICTNQAF